MMLLLWNCRLLLIVTCCHFFRSVAFSTTPSNNNLRTTEESCASRQNHKESLLKWAMHQGVIFHADVRLDSDDGDWGYMAQGDIEPGTAILTVPSRLHFSSNSLLQKHSSLQPSLDFIIARKLEDQIPQFVLLVELLRQYSTYKQTRVDQENIGTASSNIWNEWFQSLPQTFDTAVCMDEAELECLPPHAWALASVELQHLHIFRQALRLAPETVVSKGWIQDPDDGDDDLVRYLFNVVFTRCWRYPKQNQEGDNVDLVPMGDLFNHASNNNIVVTYDDDSGDAVFVTTQTVSKGSSLTLSYGGNTNPYRWLVLFGFVDETQSEIFCDLLSTSPTARHVEMGYDTDRMVFRTNDGAISNAIWNVILYSILEQLPHEQEAFFNAHKKSNIEVTQAMHAKYAMETSVILRNHIVRCLEDFKKRSEMIREAQSTTAQDDSTLLPLIERHVSFLMTTYAKAKHQVDFRIQSELAKKKQAN